MHDIAHQLEHLDTLNLVFLGMNLGVLILVGGCIVYSLIKKRKDRR